MKPAIFVASIVEGHGEVQAVPVLLRRIAEFAAPASLLNINPPLRVKVSSFLSDESYFNRYVELAARKAKAWEKSCVLILLDCEDCCPAELGLKITTRARKCRDDVSFFVILAHREYETWFLAAARSLAGTCSLPLDLLPPDAPDMIRDAKGWLSAKMQKPYNEPEHQPRMTSSFSFAEASSIHSFQRALLHLSAFFRQDGADSN